MGFYDPCPWNPDKYLYVAYTYHGQPHECTVGDLEALDAPQRSKPFFTFISPSDIFHSASDSLIL